MTSATASKKRKPTPDHSPIFSDRDNETLLLATFKMIGVSRIEVEYSGSGDSGQVDSVNLLCADGTAASYDESLHISVGEIRIDFRNVRTVEYKERTLDDAAETLAWNAIECGGQSGFYNNEGGYGKFIIDLTKSPVEMLLDHYNYIQHVEHEPSSWVSGFNGTHDVSISGHDE